ncbi:MAG: GNAT family protein [Corynebacterium sp.]|nr:GNAT family protein [Corynebacterium sp.]
MDLTQIWPPFGFQITAANAAHDIVLRTMRDEDIAALAGASATDIFGPQVPSYAFPWLAGSPSDTAAFRWSQRLHFHPHHWELPLVIALNGEPIGTVDIRADDFSSTRTVNTGSWIYYAQQGQGLGTLVRHAIAVAAFEHFQAVKLISQFYTDNTRSAAVSAKLGYTVLPDISRDDIGTLATAELCKADYTCPQDVTVTVSGLSDQLKQLMGVA